MCTIAVFTIFLKVAWFGEETKITWEPASTLPQKLIDEFEKGGTTGEVIHDSRYGVHSHTTIVSTLETEEPPPTKKQKHAHLEKGYTLCLFFRIIVHT